MFSHVMVGSNDLPRSKGFYDALFGKEGRTDEKGRLSYGRKGAVFMVSNPIDGQAATHANGGTVGFNFDSPEEVDSWYQRGVDAGGGACEGCDPPGYRENAFGKLYLAYLRDPDGNKLCGLYRPQQ
jgi:catechol 2,3-dioxygenase-like lactoylglutathione lyase family enzyme